MITEKTTSNSDEYTILFKKATKVLKEEFPELFRDEEGNEIKYEITSLQEYFSHLHNLVYGPDSANPKNRLQYTILPLDEAHFDIDANTRVITIPEAFKKNGISVQGDHGAETVYFKINRYFDFMDLNETDIYIQWETQESSGVSGIWTKDISSDPNYLIFGWALDKRITTVPGVIKFAIRFILTNDKTDEIEYSFSTLNASVAINPSLNFSSERLKIDNSINQAILNRIKNSELTNSIITLNPPIFLEPSAGTETLLLDLYDEETKQYYQNIYAQAAVANGLINYYWYKDQNKLDGTDTGWSYIQISEDEYTSPNENKTYYKKIEENTYEIISWTLNDGFKDSEGMEVPYSLIYERKRTLKITGPGEYTVKTQASIATANSNVVESKHFWNVERPKEIEFSLPTKNNMYVLSSDDEIIFTTILNANLNNYDNYQEIFGSWKLNDEVKQTFKLLPADMENGEIKYTVEINKSSEIADEVEELKDLQGNYVLTLSGYKNNSEKTGDTYKFFVCLPPIKPKVTIELNNKTLTSNVTYTNDYQLYNKTEYQWYKFNTDLLTTEEISQYYKQSVDGAYEIRTEDEIISSATQQSFTPETSGSYFCKVTNYLTDDEGNKYSTIQESHVYTISEIKSVK